MKKYTGKTIKVAIIDKDGETNPWVGTCNDDESDYYRTMQYFLDNYEIDIDD